MKTIDRDTGEGTMVPQWGCCHRARPSLHEAQRSSVSSSNTSEEEHLSTRHVICAHIWLERHMIVHRPKIPSGPAWYSLVLLMRTVDWRAGSVRQHPHGDCWTFWNRVVFMLDSSASTHAHTFTDSSHTLNHWDTHRASVYLMTNLNWSCYSCPMGRPPPLCLPPARSSEHFRLIFCPLPASSVFLFWPSWAKLSLSVHQLGSQSSHQTWPHRIASLCSPLLSSHFLFPPTLLCLSFSSSPLFSSTSSEEDRGLGPAAVSGAAYGLWSDRKPRKVTDRLLELILCSHKTWTVAQSNKYTRWRVHIGRKTGWLCS